MHHSLNNAVAQVLHPHRWSVTEVMGNGRCRIRTIHGDEVRFLVLPNPDNNTGRVTLSCAFPEADQSNEQLKTLNPDMVFRASRYRLETSIEFVGLEHFQTRLHSLILLIEILMMSTSTPN